MKIIILDGYTENPGDLSWEDFEKLGDLTVHERTPSEHMINKESIRKMKDGVILINNSRGPLIEEQNLYEALESGKVYAAGVDVVSSEPIQKNNSLLKARNLFSTPHISRAPKETRKRLMEIAAENLKAFIEEVPVNVVS